MRFSYIVAARLPPFVNQDCAPMNESISHSKENSMQNVSAHRSIILLFLVAFVLLLSGCNSLFNKDEAGGGSRSQEPDQPEPMAMGCGAGTLECSSACVDPLSDPFHCGACGIACASGQYCESGVCKGFCAGGETDCGGICQLTVSDPANCGGCGLACPVGQFCDSGLCSAACSGTICTDAVGAQRCAHLDSNNDNCGTCGVACANGKECRAGVCVEACPVGRAACGAGCVDIRSNAENCGGCGVVCQPGQACVEGQCGGQAPVCDGGACSCTQGQAYCNESCVDPLTNPLHCGACGVECLEGQQCTGGACTCVPGTTLCGASCVDVQSDSENCGVCGTVCSGGTTCQAGLCKCALGQELCGESCVDPQTDPNNCGGCGTVCAGYESCVSGICKYDGDECGGDAREIAITRVAMYQAVEFDLFSEGQMVPPDQRRVDVIANRDAMIRVFVTPTEAFLARTLSARLFVENEGEAEAIQVFHQKRNVSGPSSQDNLDSTFRVDIPGDLLKESTKFWVELAECGALPEGEVRTVRVPTTPGENGEFSARETGIIKLVFVPITHDGRTPDISESTILAYAREVERMYPTTGVEWTVRDPISSNQSGVEIDLAVTLDLVTAQRDQDGSEDEVYYYGLIDPASSFNSYCSFSCTTGVGWVTDVGSPWAASHRVAVGIGFGTDGAATFAHELGHNHGRDHAPCNVSGDGNYPYAGGSIGVWGYDLEAQELKDPASYADFMGYCNSNWVSDYSYNAYSERIASVNGVSGEFQSLVRLGDVATWYRMLVTDTDIHWLDPVERPGTPRQQGDTGYVYDSAGNVIETVEVYRVLMSHSGGYMLYVPEPQPGWFSVGAAGGPVLVY